MVSEVLAALLVRHILAGELHQAAQIANSLAQRSEALARKLEAHAC
jgi:archaellum component FlaG (FlaF/FlaG flagellin family)